jgi:hypothetical protein
VGKVHWEKERIGISKGLSSCRVLWPRSKRFFCYLGAYGVVLAFCLAGSDSTGIRVIYLTSVISGALIRLDMMRSRCIESYNFTIAF